jgi:septal ring factor EnvC (AmiA/AmiB activator)
MKQHELNELCNAQRHEIYTLRRTINEQNKDLEKKDRLISNLAKQVNNNNKQQQKLIKSIKEVIDYIIQRTRNLKYIFLKL